MIIATLKYGPLQPLFDNYLWIIGLGAALYIRWGPGIRKWCPPLENASGAIHNLGALLSGAVAITIWLLCSHCTAIPGLIYWGIVCSAFTIAGLCSYIFLRRTRLYRDRNGRYSIIGGTKLNDKAERLRWESLYPNRPQRRTDQQILDLLGDADQVWTRPSRGQSEIELTLSYLGWTVGGTAALTAFALGLYLQRDVDQHHLPMEISPTVADVWPGEHQRFIAKAMTCSRSVSFSIAEQGEGEKNAAIGEIGTTSGNYAAPPQITGDRQITIIAKSEDDRATATVTLHKGLPPGTALRVPMTGDDGSGGMGEYTLQVIDYRYSWKYREVDSFEGSLSGPELIRQINSTHSLDGFDAIISVGTASREFKTEQDECDRAGKRAFNLATWVNMVQSTFDHPKELWLLDLQRYDPGNLATVHMLPDKTAKERPLVLIGVKKLTGHLDLQAGLRDAMEKNKKHNEEIFEQILTHYPREWLIDRYAANWNLKRTHYPGCVR